MTKAEFETMQRWGILHHRVAVDYTRELMHINCWLASNKPHLIERRAAA